MMATESECDRIQRSISLLVEGEKLTPPEEQRVQDHLARCRPCSAFKELLEEEIYPSLRAAAATARVDRFADPAWAESVLAKAKELVRQEARRLVPAEPARRRRRPSPELVPTEPLWKKWLRRIANRHTALAAAAIAVIGVGVYLIVLDWEQNRALRDLLEAARSRPEVVYVPAPQPRPIDPLYGPENGQAAVTVSDALRRVGRGQITLEASELRGVLHLVRGVTLFTAGHGRAAAQSFHGAADTFTEPRLRILSLFALGTTQKVLGRHDQAIETYDRILRLLSKAVTGEQALEAMAHHFRAWSAYREACRVQGVFPKEARAKFDEAERSYRRGLELVPSYHKIHYNLAILHFTLADLAERANQKARAKELREQAAQELAAAAAGLKGRLAEDPADARAHFTLAMVYVRQGEKDLAVEQLTEAVRLAPPLCGLVRSEKVFDALRGRAEYQAILDKADRLEHVSMEIFFDASLPASTPPEEGTRSGRGARGA